MRSLLKVGEHVAVHFAENEKAINDHEEVVTHQVGLRVCRLYHKVANIKE